MQFVNPNLSNLQIELLKLFSIDVPDQDLIAIKRLLVNYFADKASDEMDKLWDEKGGTEKTMEEWVENGE